MSKKRISVKQDYFRTLEWKAAKYDQWGRRADNALGVLMVLSLVSVIVVVGFAWGRSYERQQWFGAEYHWEPAE